MMKKIPAVLFLLTFFYVSLFSQNVQPGTKAWNDANARQSNEAVQNGDSILSTAFDTTLCGLNYTTSSQKLGMRFPLLNSPSLTQPATFPIANIPFYGHVDKAYVWCVAAGNGIPINVTITNPANVTDSFPMNIVGQAEDMCWGYNGTYTYRADVTSIISGNGNYILSGLPVSPTSVGNDVNGATLMVIFNDSTATYTGSLHIDDGCIVTRDGPPFTHAMSGFNTCQNSIYANAFMIIADLQQLGTIETINNTPVTPFTEDWWNYISDTTSVSWGQTSEDYSITAYGDCFCFAVAGLYSQTYCDSCSGAVAAVDGNVLLNTSFQIIPNPGNGNFQLTISLTNAQEISVNVFDNLGQIVHTQNENATAGNFNATMNLSSLSKGVYFVQVKTTNGVATKRLIVN